MVHQAIFSLFIINLAQHILCLVGSLSTYTRWSIEMGLASFVAASSIVLLNLRVHLYHSWLWLYTVLLILGLYQSLTKLIEACAVDGCKSTVCFSSILFSLSFNSTQIWSGNSYTSLTSPYYRCFEEENEKHRVVHGTILTIGSCIITTIKTLPFSHVCTCRLTRGPS